MAVANNPYPHDVRVRREAETLTDSGRSVTVIAPAAKGQPRSERCRDVDVLRYPAPPDVPGAIGYMLEFAYVTVATALLLLWVWIRRGFDVLHLHNPPDTLVLAGVLPKLAGKRLVFDHHDLAPELYRSKYEGGGSDLIAGALLRFERLSCRLADRVVVVNHSYRTIDEGRNRVPPERIAVVRNGPPLEQLEPPDPDLAARAGAATVFGYLGHIGLQDGVDHLIRALHHLDVDHGVHDWRALIIGPSDDPGLLERLARELGVADRVEFLGYQPNARWRSLLAAADICSVPDPPNPLNERSTMIKTMEYMALGKPVVAYDLHEHRVSAGDAALYAEPGDPAAMARCFRRLIEDPALRDRLGRSGRQRIRDGLAWEFSAERLLAMYDGMKPRRPHAPMRRDEGRGADSSMRGGTDRTG